MNYKYLYNQYKEKRNLIFDLDNTIIDEKDYLYPAYLDVAKSYYKENSNEIYKFLINTFESSGRKNIFSKLTSRYVNKQLYLSDFLKKLRFNEECKVIYTLGWFQKLMKLINNEFPLYIITNGNIIQQKNKINKILFPSNVKLKKVIYANKYEKKPNPASFHELKKIFPLTNPIYIGDGLVDKQFAINTDIEFVDSRSLYT